MSRHPDSLQISVLANIKLFLLLFMVVLIADVPILIKDVMYPEQATMYLVNQTIHSWHDLLNVYLHPKGLDDVIPFFRPSGHFLIYQLLTPLIGWHSTRAMIVVNMMFLAMSGLLMIRLYQKFFPTFVLGGFFAFGIYLMHPSMILSRFLLMHFEFAHVFFLLLALYSFILFCEKNQNEKNFRHFALLGFSVLLYAVAVTFKETALMLGPVMIVYFSMSFSSQLRSRQSLEILVLLMMMSVTLGIYLTLAWPRLIHPYLVEASRHHITINDKIVVFGQFFKDLLGMSSGTKPDPALPFENGDHWRHFIFSLPARICMGLFFLAGCVNTAWGFFGSKNQAIRKSVLFLMLATLIFLVLPCNWGMALPWHWNLSILFLSLILGFAVDTGLCKWIRHDNLRISIGMSVFFLLMVLAIKNNETNLQHILQDETAMLLDREAVYHPPAIQNQLDQDSIILVAVPPERVAYEYGNAGFGDMATPNFNYDDARQKLNWMYRHYDTYYNGTLFKWAYLMPSLREELYPFTLNKMKIVPNEEIYRWLKEMHHIFCFVADDHFHWHDVTAEFRQKLLAEKNNRHMLQQGYDEQYAQKLAGNIYKKVKLPYPDSQICQYACDQDVICKGFTYTLSEDQSHSLTGCDFYNSIAAAAEDVFCPSCVSYLKQI